MGGKDAQVGALACFAIPVTHTAQDCRCDGGQVQCESCVHDVTDR